MFYKKLTRLSALVLASAALFACAKAPSADPAPSASPTEPAVSAEPTAAPSAAPTAAPTPTAEPTEQPTAEPTPEPQQEKFEYNPHPFSAILLKDVPQEYWDAVHSLIDALRKGEPTFECASEEAYKWATDPATMNALIPTACTKIKGESEDGSAPFENGIGKIHYRMPVDEFLERQAKFEEMVVNVLNTTLEKDDDEFEIALKLFDYITANYTYQHEFIEQMDDGANYITMNTCNGQCIDIAGSFTFYLLQAGVDAVQVGCSNPDMAHEWVYLVINGNGYHSDATWSLREEGQQLDLHYFLMSDELRADSGCAVDDLTAPLLPKYWLSKSSTELPAYDYYLSFPWQAYYVSLDEESKLVNYLVDAEKLSLYYGIEQGAN